MPTYQSPNAFTETPKLLLLLLLLLLLTHLDIACLLPVLKSVGTQLFSPLTNEVRSFSILERGFILHLINIFVDFRAFP